MDKILLSQQTTIAITILIGLFFIWLGYLNNKKIFNNKNYIIEKINRKNCREWVEKNASADQFANKVVNWLNEVIIEYK